MHELDIFGRPTPERFSEMRKRRGREKCIDCHRGKSDRLVIRPVYPEYARIVGVPAGSFATLTVGLCVSCYRHEGNVARADAIILGLVAAEARKKGLPMPPAADSPIIDLTWI